MRRALPLFALTLGLLGCRSDTPEAAIRKAFDASVKAVEAGDADAVVGQLHPKFAGPEGLDRPQARFYLMGLFRQGKVGVSVLSSRLEVKGRQGLQVIDVLLTRRGEGAVLPEESSRRTFQLRWELHEDTWRLRECLER